MLTSRGWWLLLIVLSLLFLGLGMGRSPLVLLSLTLLVWILVSWLIFVLQVRRVEGALPSSEKCETIVLPCGVFGPAKCMRS